jgi:AraC-like DNA-binding protein
MLQQLNLTERTFQRIFKKYVGITANEYRRICQFQMAFYQLKARQFDKLTDVVYDNGYFDQSHYTRSFKEFTNTTPNEYLQSGLKKK